MKIKVLNRGGGKMRQSINLQDMFLNKARKEEINITVFLTNNNKISGIVKGFDNYTIILETETDPESKEQLIYKHAIATIVPKTSIFEK